MSIIDDISENQKKIGLHNLSVQSKTEQIEMPKYLLIFDDIIDDKQFKHFGSTLSNFSTKCRHMNTHQIILTQDYTAIPSRIR